MSNQNFTLKFEKKDVDQKCEKIENLESFLIHQVFEDMLNTLEDQCASYATVKHLIASFKRGKFSTEDEDLSRRPVPVSTPVNIDAVHGIILSERRIGLKTNI